MLPWCRSKDVATSRTALVAYGELLVGSDRQLILTYRIRE